VLSAAPPASSIFTRSSVESFSRTRCTTSSPAKWLSRSRDQDCAARCRRRESRAGPGMKFVCPETQKRVLLKCGKIDFGPGNRWVGSAGRPGSAASATREPQSARGRRRLAPCAHAAGTAAIGTSKNSPDQGQPRGATGVVPVYEDAVRNENEFQFQYHCFKLVGARHPLATPLVTLIVIAITRAGHHESRPAISIFLSHDGNPRRKINRSIA